MPKSTGGSSLSDLSEAPASPTAPPKSGIPDALLSAADTKKPPVKRKYGGRKPRKVPEDVEMEITAPTTPPPAASNAMESSPLSSPPSPTGPPPSSMEPPSEQSVPSTPLKRTRVTSVATPSKRTKITNTSPTPRNRKPQPLPVPVTPLPLTKLTKTTSTITNAPREWSLEKLDTFVYAKLTPEGAAFVISDDAQHIWSYWWPAKVISKEDGKVTVALYGDDGHTAGRELSYATPSKDNVQSWKDWHAEGFASFIQGESPRSAAKLKTSWKTAQTAMSAEYADDSDGLPMFPSLSQSPSKKKEADKAQTKGKNGDTAQPPKTTQKTPKAGKIGKHAKSSSLIIQDDLDLSDLDDDEPDSTLTIPGELLLARDGKKSTHFWPARALGYIGRNPDRPRQPPLYKVEFFDRSIKSIPRDWFHSSMEDEFITCKLGTWKTELSENHMPLEQGAPSRSPTPEPEPDHTAPILSGEDFNALSIAEQFVYVRPVLSAIINGNYPPAEERHKAFIKGGKARRLLAESAANLSRLSEGERGRVRYEVLRWALRDERRPKRIVDESDEQPAPAQTDAPTEEPKVDEPENPSQEKDVTLEDKQPAADSTDPVPEDKPLGAEASEVKELNGDGDVHMAEAEAEAEPAAKESNIVADTEVDKELPFHPEEPTKNEALKECHFSFSPAPAPPRPTGSEEYESLAGSDRLEYCSHVLLREAAIQVLIWRAGKRESLEILSPEEEQALHDFGKKEVEKRDWVFDIMIIREQRAKASNKKLIPQEPEQTPNGKRSRTRTQRR
ncbi:hypothetical protein SISNIDRAFT_488832 [Sistotremastrum niveocremeum HHB9708]|uniref:PWWP domain-containing protein n=1 Tax=Sistotremastrum niveocremeum HHB9708 TaxID=1314777 RepID=A0A164QUD0_9AGAM|nr:hypothetical protein SISNIDRAFT_488832 [Sistotremastrum niveocremeum HHB9708]